MSDNNREECGGCCPVTTSEVVVYPVGILEHWRRGTLCSGRRYVAHQLRVRDFRAVKNFFNGYLAETHTWPLGVSRCGSGWTKRRARRSWARQCAKAAR